MPSSILNPAPAPAYQVGLRLPISTRTVMVTTETVRATLGVDAETVANMADTGELRWVFDMARGESTRHLIFWGKELVAPETVRNLTPAHAVDQIIGTTREHLRATEVSQLLLVSRPHVFGLWQDGDLEGPCVGHTLKISRASLARCLRARLLGANPSH